MSKRKISISTGELQVKYGEEEAIRFAASIGCDGIDFNLCNRNYDYRNPDSIYSKSDEEIVAHFKHLAKIAKECGIEICHTHGRIEGFKNIPSEDEALIKNGRIDCMATKALGSPYCVMHSVTSIFMGPDCEPALMHSMNYEMFCKLLEYAKQYDIKIASETFGDAVKFNACDFFGNIDEFIKSYEDIRRVNDYKDYFFICVDTGHSNKASRFNGNPEPGDVIRKLGSNIKVLHLNDNDKLTDQHKTPMTGCIDWEDVFNALDEVGYNGFYNMELRLCHFGKDFLKETAEFSVKVMRNMLDTRYGATE